MWQRMQESHRGPQPHLPITSLALGSAPSCSSTMRLQLAWPGLCLHASEPWEARGILIFRPLQGRAGLYQARITAKYAPPVSLEAYEESLALHRCTGSTHGATISITHPSPVWLHRCHVQRRVAPHVPRIHLGPMVEQHAHQI